MEEEINFENNNGNELTANDFSGGSFIKNPAVGETLVLEIMSVQRNSQTKAKSKEGVEFATGLKQKDGQVKRFDIHCAGGIYTISSWEIFFKLLGKEGLLLKYAKEHNGKFEGAKISMKRLLDGGYSSTKPNDLAKILNVTLQEAVAYQEEIKKAIKESRLYEVKLL